MIRFRLRSLFIATAVVCFLASSTTYRASHYREGKYDRSIRVKPCGVEVLHVFVSYSGRAWWLPFGMGGRMIPLW